MKLLTPFFVVLILASVVFAQPQVAAVQVPVADEAGKVRLEAFDKVWNTVNEKHYDPTFGGVDWNKVRKDYYPKAAAAATDDELHSVLRAMLGELKLSHFGIFPKDLAAQIAGTAGVGVELKMIGGQPVIERVEPGSTAEAAGLRSGFVVQKINGSATADLLKPLEVSFASRNLSDRMKLAYRERALEALVSGAPETKVSVEVLNAKNEPQVFEMVRKPFDGEMSKPLGNFPAQQVKFESRRLEDSIGYIRFNMWVMPQMTKIRAAVREFADARAIIFDLRGNPGGIGGIATGVAGLFVAEQSSLGTMTSRRGALEFVAYPQNDGFRGPVVILTDYGTGSTSEVFAAGMQEIGRAVVIGETSAGAVLPSVFDKLPTGAIFQYAISDYRSPKNILIEGRGVVPDTTVVQTRDSLLAGRDAQLEAAIQYLRK